MDRNKGTHLREAMKRSVEKFNFTWSCPVLLSELDFFLNTLSQGVLSRHRSIFYLVL